MNYDVIIIGAGPGGIYSAYELTHARKDLRVAVFETGNPLHKRKCPIDGKKIKSCIHCKTCAIMNGFGGASAFSDGKYNITNQFGGTLHEHIGKNEAIELMQYVDQINLEHGAAGTKLLLRRQYPDQKAVPGTQPASAGGVGPPFGHGYQLCRAGKAL